MRSLSTTGPSRWRLLVLALLGLAGGGTALLAFSAQATLHSPAPPAFAEAAPPASQASEMVLMREALVGLVVAGVLGCAMAFRPQRRGTPPRSPAVIHTQVILALVGALVMIVVGASLARAFGIVGAASLVRYRAKIDDPKDAGVMLACLGIGLASGVGLYSVAALSTLLILVVVWALESLEPEGSKSFLLKVKAKEPDKVQDGLEDLLRRSRIKYELRTSSKDDLVYSVKVPLTKKIDRLTAGILALDKRDQMEVNWSDKAGKDKS